MAATDAVIDSRLKDRIALITGATSGIGRATALRYAASGARVVCADLSPGTPSVADEINDKHGADTAIFVTCDVTSEADIQSAVQQTVAWAGRLDILGTFAGVGLEGRRPYQRCHEIDTAVFDKTLAVNLRGVLLSCKFALAQFMAQDPRPPNARGEATRGWIVNVASVHGLVGGMRVPAYTSSKHAVVGLTRQLAMDYAPDRIHVNCICPGYVRTPLLSGVISNPDIEQKVAARHPWNALGEPEDIADVAVFLASDDARWITGHPLVVDGGYTAV